MENRFELKQSDAMWWVVTDKESGVCVKFREGHFNDTQETNVPDNLTNNFSEVARVLREIGDYMAKHHYDIAIHK